MMTKLLKIYGSPLYVYETNTLIKRAAELKTFEQKLCKSINTKVKLHYSTKSNGNPHILRLIREMGIAVDAMSPIELELDKMAGYEEDDILYVCNNISQEEMVKVVDQGILICLDSISQLELLGQARPGSEVMVRINPGSFQVGHSEKVITSGENTKFGVSEANLQQLFKIADQYQLKIIGMHQHLGSLFLNDGIEEYISGVEKGLQIAKQYFQDLSIIDLGGGFGVPYREEEERLDLELVLQKLTPILKNFLKEYPSKVEFKFEPGRYIPCEAGYILGKVNAVKNENGKVWIGTDIGMNILARPTLYKSAYHQIEIIKSIDEELPMITAEIVGNVCESGDILGKERKVVLPEVGDFVKVYNAGAYGYSMASSYTGRPKPAEVLVEADGKTTRLIRQRENFEDIASKFPKF